MNLWRDSYLTRDEVVSLLDTGTRWSVTYCEGSRLPPASGRGQTLPQAVLERIHTDAAKRKLQRGSVDRTYFRAEARSDASETVLELVEDL